MSRLPLLSIALLVLAAGLGIYAFARDGFWYGAAAIFLVWWADNERKRVSKEVREQLLIAQHAPELMGKSFVEASVHVLDAIDRFKLSANPDARQRFFEELATCQKEWTNRGEPMPPWATVSLLRHVELASVAAPLLRKELEAVQGEKRELITRAAKDGKTVSTEGVLKHVEALKIQYRDAGREKDVQTLDRIMAEFREKHGPEIPVDKAQALLEEIEADLRAKGESA